MARCIDEAAYITNLLDRVDIGDIAVRIADADALIDALAFLRMRLCAVFHPGEKND